MNTYKKTILQALLGAFIGMGSTCYADEAKVLNVYNWTDYIAPDTIANFEKETGIKVRYDTYESNESLYAKLLTKKTGYDIVVPSSNWAKLEIEKGAFQKLDKSKLPNWKNLDTGILTKLESADPGNNYLAGWLWGYTSIGINTNKVIKALGNTTIPDNLWELVFNPVYTSKLKSCGIAYLDAPDEIFPLALQHLGKPAFSQNEEDYRQAFEMLVKVKPDIQHFIPASQSIKALASGSVCISISWAGDINQARKLAKEENTNQYIVATMPKSGATLFLDTMAIPVDAAHPDNSHKFINYILKAEVHAGITNATNYANPNKAALKFVKANLRDDQSIFLSSDNIGRLTAPGIVDDKTRAIMQEYFAAFKAGKLIPPLKIKEPIKKEKSVKKQKQK
ncbi:MAG: extracellular solute-binding protein [Methylotenera sp.]|uniref:extracellular solute-binding protein n=1 Tax=Methylotenera sp. TaxID=2051956 RepID=UPI00271EAAF3|nr:extracellular solute-binding protein [Methylotenera sp.]MDO9394750.1 extracellular solute-binding protein [Methylotenera sp.]